MPSGMNEQARAVWPEVVAMLKANDVLFKTDGLAIATLCSNLMLFWQADRAVQEFGMNPSVERVRSDAEKKRACWQLFGLDPSSRPGVQTSDSAERNPESALDSVLRAKGDKDESRQPNKYRLASTWTNVARKGHVLPTILVDRSGFRYTLFTARS
jgi:phage terminase small subunit